MKHIAICALVATIVLTGCNKKQDPPLASNDTLVDQRPAGRATTDSEPVVDTSVTQLSDAEIDSIVGTPATSGTPIVTVDTTGTSTVAGGDTSVSDIRPAPEVGLTHTIRKGETLWSLAAKYLGRRWTEIVDANPGLQPKRLPIGKTIRIPQ